MKTILILLCSIVFLQSGNGQSSDTLKIEDCFTIASKNSPLQRKKTLSGEESSYRIKNISNNWFPSVSFSAQATYNSETIDFSNLMKNLPVSIPSLPLDQYKVWADINQQIYDGGTIKAQKLSENATYEAGIQQVEIDLRNIRQQVSQVYFSLLITGKSSSIIQVTLRELQERKKVVQAGIDQGAVLPENLLAIEAEELKFKQQLTELDLTHQQLFEVMSVLMDSSLDNNMVLAEPVEPAKFNDQVNRPEYLLFEKTKEIYKANQKLVSSADYPKIFAFSQAAYGRPGFNVVSKDFHPFYSLGLGLKWNFINYGDNRRQIKILDIQKDMIDIKQELFDEQLNIQIETENTSIKKYNELILQDQKILELRIAISAAGLSKLTHGIITSTDYLTDMNAELLTRLQLENHKILKLQAIYNYMILRGEI